MIRKLFGKNLAIPDPILNALVASQCSLMFQLSARQSEDAVPLSYAENNCNLGASDNKPNNNSCKISLDSTIRLGITVAQHQP